MPIYTKNEEQRTEQAAASLTSHFEAESHEVLVSRL